MFRKGLKLYVLSDMLFNIIFALLILLVIGLVVYIKQLYQNILICLIISVLGALIIWYIYITIRNFIKITKDRKRDSKKEV